MHQLAEVTISNFRSCKQVTVALDDFTPIVGCNNSGKSDILSAIEWLLDGSALTQSEFKAQGAPVVIGGVIQGIAEALLGAMSLNQQKQIRPYVEDESLEFRRSMGIVDWHKAQAPVGESTLVFRDSALTADVAKTNLAAILQQHGLQNIRSL